MFNIKSFSEVPVMKCKKMNLNESNSQNTVGSTNLALQKESPKQNLKMNHLRHFDNELSFKGSLRGSSIFIPFFRHNLSIAINV